MNHTQSLIHGGGRLHRSIGPGLNLVKGLPLVLLVGLSLAVAEDSATPIITAPASASIVVGGGIKIKTSPSFTATAKLMWTSSDAPVAEVLKNGWILGLKPGKATVRVSDGARSESCLITVTNALNQPRDPTSVKEFADNRRFELDGRICFGSELCGYVLGVPRKGFLRSNRIINPTPLNPKDNLLWEVAPGAKVIDGAGIVMGTVAPRANHGNKRVPASAFNFGMSKVIDGRLYLYGFSTRIVVDPGLRTEVDPRDIRDGVLATSAWVPLDSILDKETLIDRFGVGRGKLPPLPLESQRYRITGGDPKGYVIPEGELAIVQVANGPVPSHYLRRPSGTINVLYSVPGFGLGGQGLDSFLICDGLAFRPARGVRSFVQPTYFPLKHPKAKQIAPRTMTFLYGSVEAPGCEPIFGWIAKEALGSAQ